MENSCQGYNPSPTNSALDWPQLKASDAAGGGSTRARVQGTLLRRSGRAENGQRDEGDEENRKFATLPTQWMQGVQRGKTKQSGTGSSFKGFADVGLTRFSAAWACSRELIPGAARLRGDH